MSALPDALTTIGTVYRVADNSLLVEASDPWAAEIVQKLFAGWYLNPVERGEDLPGPVVAISTTAFPPPIPRHWESFDIAGGGICFTNGLASYIDIEGSVIAVGLPGHATVEVWTNGPLELQSAALTRVVTYALSAALRRCGLFELHSGAVANPETGAGVLIIGPSGSGKSTLTVQLAASGWPFLTDDVLALSDRGTVVQAWPLRRCFAITATTFKSSGLLTELAPLDYGGARTVDKKQFMPQDVFEVKFKENCIPRTLFFSQVTEVAETQVTALSPGETMTRLIRMNPWSSYDRSTAARHLTVLAALVKQAKAYSLSAGTDLLDPETAAKLIANYTTS